MRAQLALSAAATLALLALPVCEKQAKQDMEGSKS